MDIKSIAVFGAGTMGAAIAQHFCMKGHKVWLVDLNSGAIDRARDGIKKSLDEAQEKAILTKDAAESAYSRLRPTTQLGDIREVDLVVEAIFEDLEVKRGLFRELEGVVSPKCILATNTSSFLVEKIADGLKVPERVVGVHYFYHAAKNKLVEIIPGSQSDTKIIHLLENFYRGIDKIPIVVKDSPGFAINRFFVPWLNEATKLYEEGKGSIASIEDVARRTFNINMGPFGLMNATGVPIAQHAAEGLASVLGPHYAPSQILRKQVQLKEPWNLQDTGLKAGGKNDELEVQERLLAASVGIAAQLVQEGVVDAASLDLGARVGLRWAFGPFELLRKLGREDTEKKIMAQMKIWGLNLRTCPDKLAWVKIKRRQSDALIIFDIPDRLNALNEGVIESLSDVWNQVESDKNLKRVIFVGRGKAFVAGADIKFFLDAMDKKDYRAIERFTAAAQDLFNRISASPLKTMAYLNGLTLGGGLELALCCRYRVATTKAMLSFPETGIGIYPGLGGTQRSSRLLGKGLAKYLVATGSMINAEQALKYGLIDQIVSPARDEDEIFDLPKIQSQSGRARGLKEEEFAGFSGVLDEEALRIPFIKENEKILKRKAPKSLALAMQLIDEGQGVSLDDGLKLELKHLEEIFKTRDARTGLLSVMTKTRPEFQGH